MAPVPNDHPPVVTMQQGLYLVFLPAWAAIYRMLEFFQKIQSVLSLDMVKIMTSLPRLYTTSNQKALYLFKIKYNVFCEWQQYQGAIPCGQ